MKPATGHQKQEMRIFVQMLPMAKRKKTWKEKLHTNRQPEVAAVDKDFAGVRKGQRMLVPTPLLVDQYIRQIPEGHFTDPLTLRKDLAAGFGAEVTCPLTTGIFIRIVAEAAYEAYDSGTPVAEITPFWRCVQAHSPTAKKLSFGRDFLLARQKEEGII